MSSALPPIDQSLIPAGIRAQGPKAVELYDTALNFEGVLDQQLTQSLTEHPRSERLWRRLRRQFR